MSQRPLPPTASVAHEQAGGKLHAPSAARNSAAITDLLTSIAPASGIALELASGTGQHLMAFARAMPSLNWQPTEVAPDRLSSIAAHAAEADLPNVLPAKPLNATHPGWGKQQSADLIVLINLLHLISAPEAQTLIGEVAQALTKTGRFVLYGPFMRSGDLTSDGDRSFHASLTASDPAIGYKNDIDVQSWMRDAGLRVRDVVEMPANNLAILTERA